MLNLKKSDTKLRVTYSSLIKVEILEPNSLHPFSSITNSLELENTVY